MRFVVSGKVTVSVSTVVDAESEDRAAEIANERPLCDVVHTESEMRAWQIDTDGAVFDVVVYKGEYE